MRKWISILLLCSFISCGDKYCLENVKDLNGSWAFSDAFISEVNISDASCPMASGKITLIHTDDYPFENIYLRNSIIVDGHTLLTDIVSFPLQDHLGIWKGNKKGKQYQIELDLPNNYNYPPDKDFTFKIEQYTREQTLRGVSKIQLAIF